MRRTGVSARSLQVALLAVVTLAALLLSMAAMHASMVEGHRAGGHALVGLEKMPAAMAAQVDDRGSSDHAMGDMNVADCLLVGMVCFLSAVAVLLLAFVVGRLRTLLRPRAAAQSLLGAVGRLRPPEPPSLLVLSICRT
jgi:hypothetical protein